MAEVKSRLNGRPPWEVGGAGGWQKRGGSPVSLYGPDPVTALTVTNSSTEPAPRSKTSPIAGAPPPVRVYVSDVAAASAARIVPDLTLIVICWLPLPPAATTALEVISGSATPPRS